MRPNIIDLFDSKRKGRTSRLPTQEEIARRWRKDRDMLVELAHVSSFLGYSWRNANVGCAILGARKGTNDNERFFVACGSNFTLSPMPRMNGRPKCCAERVSASGFLGLGGVIMAAAVVYSDHLQSDDVSGARMSHLFPCAVCVDEVLLPYMPLSAPILGVRTYGLLESDFLERPDASGFLRKEITYGELLRSHNQAKAGRS